LVFTGYNRLMAEKSPKVDEKERLKKVADDLAKARAPGKPSAAAPKSPQKP